MLILTRKPCENIMIGDTIELSVVDIKGDQVKIGINAPKNVKVYRKEVYDSIYQKTKPPCSRRPIFRPWIRSSRKKE